MKNSKNGVWLVVLAYTLWGILPGYWKLLSSVSPLEVLAHRIIWSALFLGSLLFSKGRLRTSLQKLKDPQIMKTLVASTLLITANWLIYVWALGKGHFIEAGLGYYICPLFTLALGRILLDERLTTTQAIAVLLVSAGVLTKILVSGAIPAVALGLAATFALYTLIRKTAAIDPLEGLFIETVLAGVPAILYVSFIFSTGQASYLHQALSLDFLLTASGVITALPLLWLVSGAPTTPLKIIAIIQFVSPTLMVFLGILSGDMLKVAELPAYLLIWTGIATYLLPAKAFGLAKRAV